MSLVIVDGNGKVVGPVTVVATAKGVPVYGPRVRRVLTAKELADKFQLGSKRQGAKFRQQNPDKCLVPVE